MARGGPSASQGPGAHGRGPKQTRVGLGRVIRSQRGPGAVTELWVSMRHRAPGQNTLRPALGKSHCVLLMSELVSMDPNFRAPSKEAGSEVHITWIRLERAVPAPSLGSLEKDQRPGGGRGCWPLEAGKEMILASCTVRVHGKLH